MPGAVASASLRCCERSVVHVADARTRLERWRRLDVQRPKVAARAAAAADLLGRQPLGELAAARLEALGSPRRHTQQARGVAVDKVRVRVRARALGL